MPCSGVSENHSDNKTDLEASHSHNHSDDCNHENCSPFCICSCCPVNLVINESGLEKSVKLVFDNIPVADQYQDFINSSYSYVLFHPPIA